MRRRLISVALVASAALSSSAVLSAPAEARHQPGPYVAMGDSYASGAGIMPLDPAADPRCSQSTLNYAHVIAHRTSVKKFTDVSCGGAKTKDFTTAQHPGVAPQLDALNRRTRLVTLTIGGNDGDVFGNSFSGCATLTASDPTGNPCERTYGKKFERQVTRDTYPALVRTFKAIHRAAPRAKVAVPTYLRILPAKGSPHCTKVTGIAQGDVPYLGHLQKTLHLTVKKAARRSGVHYVDLWAASRGHDACQAPNTRWVEPLEPINAAPTHPNAKGEAVMARAMIRELNLPRR
ncbi:SGNH/GDSL hydrolase family protein [Demetria terragena]|uniref:SGNH/GDSL hydrolase family protein n=1 Tax=Demetria terragena TaxID=63959 RepID=UPI0003816714|nr:SGNH/GDSL hydrolase family protein [Demetria terragena]